MTRKLETGAGIVSAGIAASQGQSTPKIDHGTLTEADLEPAWSMADATPLDSWRADAKARLRDRDDCAASGMPAPPPVLRWRHERSRTRPIDDLVENFAFLDDWEDRYRYVIELGRTLPALSDAEHSDANKVRGCASQVWLVSKVVRNGEARLTFRGDSDAHIVRGLIAILLAIYSGRTAREIVEHGRGGDLRADRPSRAPDVAALERPLLDGGAHPRRRRGGAVRRSGDLRPVVLRAPVAQLARAWPCRSRVAAQPVVTRERFERDAKHKFRRARRPSPLAFHRLEALQEAADVDEHAGELRADGAHGAVEAEAGGERHVGQVLQAPRRRERRPVLTLADQFAVTRGCSRPISKSRRNRSAASIASRLQPGLAALAGASGKRADRALVELDDDLASPSAAGVFSTSVPCCARKGRRLVPAASAMRAAAGAAANSPGVDLDQEPGGQMPPHRRRGDHARRAGRFRRRSDSARRRSRHEPQRRVAAKRRDQSVALAASGFLRHHAASSATKH